MTTTKKSATAAPSKEGTPARPANMHTDVARSRPHAQPLNMHTDIVIAKTGSTVTITGAADHKGTVGIRLPAKIADALKMKATPLPTTATEARAEVAAPDAVYVLDDSATVGGTLSTGLTVTGPATAGGTATSVVITISRKALNALRVHRDAL